MPEQSNSGVAAVSVLESAVHLLRQTPLQTLLYHWAGGVPFAVTLLIFWNDVTQFRTSGAACAADAALATLGLAWMVCWRALFAGRLRSQLSGDAYVRPGLWQLIGTQVFLGCSKLIMIPVGLLSVVGFANIVAFYRFAAVLGGRPAQGDVFQMMAQASRLARVDVRRSWLVMLLAWVLTLAMFLNLTIVLISLPQLIRTFTGAETEFSRIGVGLATQPLFWGFAFTVCWLATDPFYQAVYCVLCFRAESASTGEDLRAALRRLRNAAAVAALVIAGLCGLPTPLRAAAPVPPQQLHDSVQQALKSHEYDWRLPAAAAQESKPSALAAFGEKVLHYLNVMLKAIGKLIGKILNWIFEKLSGIMPTSQGGTAPVTALHWSVYALTGVIVLLAGFLIWRMVRNRNRKTKAGAAGPIAAIRLDDESVTPDRLPEDQWIEMAEDCLRKGDYRLALRAFYLANLAYLGRRELLTINAGKTNREYEAELRRRARGAVDARELFRVNLAAFERVWYGLHEVDADAVAEFRSRNARMKTLIDPPREAAA